MASLGVVFRDERLATAGRELRYLIGGEGPTVVFIHGIGGLRQTPVHDLLATDHCVVLIELPGFGDDDEDEQGSFADYVDIVRDFVRTVADGPCVLVGTSFGARIAAAIAASDDGIEGLVLLSPVVLTDGFELPSPDDPPSALVAHPERLQLEPLDPKIRARHLRLALRYMSEDLTDVVRELVPPTVVAFGTADETISPFIGSRYVELNSQIFLVLFYDSGHLIEYDRPEALANLIRGFVAHKRDFHLVRESGMLFP
jgi:pimeloyl-ACP methyl ester carboxylesterase